MNILILSDNDLVKNHMHRIFSRKPVSCDICESDKVDVNDKDLAKKYNLIISAHCKKIFPKYLVRSVRCINLHPGLNPHNRGWYPHVFSIINKLPSGATIHEIDERIDHGHIIFQKEVEVDSVDTSFTLYNKIIEAEIQLFEKNYDVIINNKYNSYQPDTSGNLNFKKDFDNLCKIDLSNLDTFENHINILRALTFGNYKNAYFLDTNGKKVFIEIRLH